MPNSKSAKKRMRQSEVRRTRNRARKSVIKTEIRKVREAVAAGDVDKAEAQFGSTVARLDKAAAKGIIHSNVASRSKSRLSAAIKAAKQKKQGASALDISKALLDEGFHSPTVYFLLIVPEAMMIEPTETEPKETLDAFAAAMLRIAERAKTDPASVRDAPKHAPLRRLDEVGAARKPVLRYRAEPER